MDDLGASGDTSMARRRKVVPPGRADVLVELERENPAGTAASSRGVATALEEHRPGGHVAVVEPAGSAVLSGGAPGPHELEDIGIGDVPPLWEPAVVDETVPVGTDDARAMTRRRAREEGLFAGTSSGANALAAIDVAQRLGPGSQVVTLMADSGLKHLGTNVYRTGPRPAGRRETSS